MIDALSLAKKTGAYKILSGEKLTDGFSHAYLFVSADEFLGEYVKQFAYLMTCTGDEKKDERLARLIKDGFHPDVVTYPIKNESVTAEEAVEIVRESFVKPLETDKKVFIIRNADKMNAQAQNKLLKTLEEPPKNVYFLLCAKTEYPLLQTIKSRVKKFEINGFSAKDLYEVLTNDYQNQAELNRAIALSDKTLSGTLEILADEKISKYDSLATEVLTQMLKSTQVLYYSNKITALGSDLERFFSVLECKLKDLLLFHTGKENLVADKAGLELIKDAKGFKIGSIIHSIECVNEVYKRLKFNANATAVTEWLLFQILEGKYKWQKL